MDLILGASIPLGLRPPSSEAHVRGAAWVAVASGAETRVQLHACDETGSRAGCRNLIDCDNSGGKVSLKVCERGAVITEENPSDWRALETEVARILEECGFDVSVERTVELVRGTAEIDVYAEEMNRGRRSVILCECKYWKKRIPKGVVHAFRTTVVDSGANIGYIVGSSGFQAGADEAARMTNVRLLTWQQFQEEFQEQWLEHHIVPKLWRRIDRFLSWTEPMPPAIGRPLTKDEADVFWETWRSYQPLLRVLMPFMEFMQQLRREPVSLPLCESEAWSDAMLPADLMSARGYREFFNLATAYADAAVVDLRAAAHADEE